jgi:membrane-associated phospholipid phosphatase
LIAAIGSSGLVGIIVMIVFPTAPPRLVGFRDVVESSPWAQIAHPESLMNPYGAMPSFHIAWSLLAAAALYEAIRGWVGKLVLLQPGLMAVAVVATANHWVLDVVAGAGLAATAWWGFAPGLLRLVDDARLRDANRTADAPHTQPIC